MEELEARGHIVIKGCLLLKRAFSAFRNNSHGQLLVAHMPQGTLDVDNRGWAEESFFAAVGLLGNGGVEANDGSHRHDACWVLRNMITNDATYLAMRIIRV